NFGKFAVVEFIKNREIRSALIVGSGFFKKTIEGPFGKGETSAFSGSIPHHEIFVRVALVELDHLYSIRVLSSHDRVCQSFGSEGLAHPGRPRKNDIFLTLQQPP